MAAPRSVQLVNDLEAILRDELPLLSYDQVETMWSSLFRVVSNLGQHRNFCLAPINRLPVEVLERIFRFVATPQAIGFGGTERHPRVLQDHSSLDDIESLRHVCHHWLAVTMSCPLLWCDVVNDQHHDAHVHGILRRERIGPLRVHIKLPLRDETPSARVLQRYRERIQELHLTCEDPDDPSDSPTHPAFAETISSSAPLLECLTISGYISELHPRYSSQIFRGIAPKLKALALTDIPIIPLDGFTELVHVHLEGVDFDSNLLQDSGTLLNLLRNSPRMETLHLRGLHHLTPRAVGSVPGSHPSSSIVLRHLRALFIDGMDSNIAFPLLSHLALPPHVVVSLFDIRTNSSPFDASHLPRFDASHLPLNIRDIDGLSALDFILHESKHSYDEYSYSYYVIAQGPRSGVWISSSAYFANDIALMYSLYDIIPRQNLEVIRIHLPHMPPYASADLLQRMLADVPSLKTLVLRVQCMDYDCQNEYLRFTAGVLSPSHEALNAKLLAPNLVSLAIDVIPPRISCKRAQCRAQRCDDDPLGKLAAARAGAGAALRTLAFRPMDCGTRVPETPREHVADVRPVANSNELWPLEDIGTGDVWSVKNDWWRLHHRGRASLLWKLESFVARSC